MKSRVAVVKTYDALNLVCFLLGLEIVWRYRTQWAGTGWNSDRIAALQKDLSSR